MLQIGLSRTGVTVVEVRGWLHRKSTVISDQSVAGPAPLAAVTMLDSILSGRKHKHQSACVTLADEYVRFFLVTPPKNAASLNDCRAAAEMRFQSLYGDSASAWHLQADWDLSKPFLACAMPQELRQALVQTASKHKLILIEVAPHFVASWNRWSGKLRKDAWFALVHDRNLTLAALHNKQLRSVRTISMPVSVDGAAEWVTEQIRLEALRLNVAPPRLLQYCGNAETRWDETPDSVLRFERFDKKERGDRTVIKPLGVGLACATVWQ